MTHIKLFCDETLRPLADVLAGMLDDPRWALDAWKGKGFSSIVGFDQTVLDVSNPPSVETLQAMMTASQNIADSDSGGRNILTTFDVFLFLRALRALHTMIEADPQFRILISKFAVNPKPTVAM